MAREIRGVSPAGTLYARILNSNGLWWNGSGFEAYSAANYAAYVVPMTEQGNSGVYVADFPTGIAPSGTYEYFVHRQAGGSPAETDLTLNTGKVDWTGSSAAVVASGKITGVSPVGTLYSRVMNSSGLWWNGSAFEAYASGDYSLYVVTMAEQGNSGVYFADFPPAIQTPGTYDYFVYRQAGASPAEGDVVINTGKVTLTASMAAPASTAAMSGSSFYDYVLRKFKRKDKETEVYEAITDAIQAMRVRFMFDEAEVEATTTDVIGFLGDYKLNLETDMGLLLEVRVEDGNTGSVLVRKSKSEFDALYPGINVDGLRGYPLHYCVFAGQIQIGPAPDRLTYVFRLAYSRRAGTVTSTSMGVPFTDLYRDMLRDLVLSYLYDGLDELDRANYYEGKFEGKFLLATRREQVNSGNSSFNVLITNF